MSASIAIHGVTDIRVCSEVVLYQSNCEDHTRMTITIKTDDGEFVITCFDRNKTGITRNFVTKKGVPHV